MTHSPDAVSRTRTSYTSKPTTVIATPGESIDSLIRRFKKGVDAAGIMRELRQRKGFRSKSERRREKSRAARTRRGNTSGAPPI